ncbi:tyrosine--tRNA ligase, partial [Candidatus Falkowbacteria bacterium]|nr:tyrosine--tRNA ligase [Candidatus Falkowbacteria bacterium]
MPKVINDKRLVSELLTRGVEKIYPSYQALEKKLLSGDKIRLYCGYDPSAASLHIGNAIALNKLAQFQALGHELIFLIGDFTGRIGDPTDKKAARQKLTSEEVLNNAKDYVKQAAAYLKFDGPNPARVEYNSKWQDKLNFSDLIELSSHFTVQQMIQRDMFQERLKDEKPIYLHEFLYPLVQA